MGEDGRHERRARNRDAVVDALLALVGDGDLAPSAEAVAARAGLSSRSLFRYFADTEALVLVTQTVSARLYSEATAAANDAAGAAGGAGGDNGAGASNDDEVVDAEIVDEAR